MGGVMEHKAVRTLSFKSCKRICAAKTRANTDVNGGKKASKGLIQQLK